METSQKHSIYYGYIVMLACAISNSLLSTIGMQATQFANGLMAKDPSVSISATALGLGYTVFALMQGVPGLFFGKYIVKHGPKKVFLIGSVVAIAVGVIFANVIDKSPILYVLGYGLGYGFVGFCASQLAAQTLVNNWFLKKRGLGSAVRVVTGSLLGLIAPTILNWATSGGNWRFGWYIIAIAGAVSVVAVLLLMKDKPSDIGVVIDGGDDTQEAKTVTHYTSTVFKRNPGDYTPFREAIRSYRFWALAVMAMGGFCVSNLLYSPGSIYFLGEAGMSSNHLVTAQMVQTCTTLIGAMIVNRLADRIEPIRLVAICIAIMGLGTFGATHASSTTPIFMYLFFFSVAIGMIGTMQIFAIGLGNLFGIEEFPQIQGVMLCLGSVVSSQVSTIAGTIFDKVGSYIPAFCIFSVVGIVCIIPSLFVKITKTTK